MIYVDFQGASNTFLIPEKLFVLPPELPLSNEIEEINKDSQNTKDLETHLSTIFTEIRLKQYVEIRSIDACEWDCHCAAPAFYTGLIYGNLDEGLDVIKNWRSDEVINAYLDAPKKGLLTEIHGKNMIEWGEL